MDPERRPDHFTAAIGQRYDTPHLLSGEVKPRGIELEFPPVPRNPVTGAPMPLYSLLARDHSWDIGEQAFSTYLMAWNAGRAQIALPIFPSCFFPHTGLWVHRQSGVAQVEDLVGRRVACGSFGTNYSVWCRGVLTHQYDLPVERMTWVESVQEHVAEFRPPARFTVERLPGEREAAVVLSEGETDAASLPGPAGRADPERVKPLFEDPYPELASFAEAHGFMPINTLITVRLDAVERNPEMPRLIFDAFADARACYEADIAAVKEDAHMGLSLLRLKEAIGLDLPRHGFQANRRAIQTMIAFAYSQGIIGKLAEPEDLFLLTDT